MFSFFFFYQDFLFPLFLDFFFILFYICCNLLLCFLFVLFSEKISQFFFQRNWFLFIHTQAIFSCSFVVVFFFYYFSLFLSVKLPFLINFVFIFLFSCCLPATAFSVEKVMILRGIRGSKLMGLFKKNKYVIYTQGRKDQILSQIQIK